MTIRGIGDSPEQQRGSLIHSIALLSNFRGVVAWTSPRQDFLTAVVTQNLVV